MKVKIHKADARIIAARGADMTNNPYDEMVVVFFTLHTSGCDAAGVDQSGEIKVSLGLPAPMKDEPLTAVIANATSGLAQFLRSVAAGLD